MYSGERMRLKNHTISLAIAALLLGVGVLVFTQSRSPVPPRSVPTPSGPPAGGVSVSPSPSYFPEDISKRIPECTLTGTIEFSGGVFRHRDAFFRYDKVDDPHDIIVWGITPKGEDISIGPNRFSQLSLPKGQETLTIGFSAPPQKKEYRLSASIQYPYFVNDQVEVLTKGCSGSIRLVVL